MRHTSYIVLIALLNILFASCEHKELCYEHPHTTDVKVAFDWRNALGANPETMSIYLYPKDGGDAIRQDFTNKNGGVIQIPPGKYSVLCLNSDTESTLYRNIDSWAGFEVYMNNTTLLNGLSKVPGTTLSNGIDQAEDIALPPTMIWSDRTEEVTILPNEVEQIITLFPSESVAYYSYEIRNAKNLKYILSISASLSGMANGFIVALNKPGEKRSTIPFPAISDGVSTVKGSFLTYGHCPTKNSTHQFVVYAILTDNSKWYYTYDVTSQIHNAPDQRHIHIILDGISLPKPIVNDGGFQPDMDEWVPIDVDINM